MKHKKIMLGALVLLAILTIGVVSASEDIASDVMTESSETGDVQLSQENDVIEILGDENSSFVEDDFDEDCPYYIFVNEDEIISDSENDDYDENTFVAGIILPNDTTEGRFTAYVGDEILFVNHIDGGSDWHNDEAGNLKCHIYLKDMNLEHIYDGAEVDFSFFVGDEKVDEYTKIMMVQATDSTIRFYYDENDGEWDGEDGVIIKVINGDDRGFDLNGDSEVTFALISVSDELQGRIRIYRYDEDELNIFFEKSLSDISNKVADDENEGFTVYSICLQDFGENLNDVLDARYFEIGFFEDDGGDLNRIDNRAYNIEYYDDGGVVSFWECFDDDEEEEDDEHRVSIFVDAGKDYPTSGVGDENFITVTAPNNFEGRVIIFSSNKKFFDKNLNDFESNKVQVVEDEHDNFSIYSISLKDVSFFEGSDALDRIEIAVVNPVDIQSLYAALNYKISFNDDSTFSLLELFGIRIFYGNLVTGETSDGMISFATTNFMEINIPNSSSVNEMNIAVDYGDEIKTYSLDDFNVVDESDEEFSGKVYYMELNDEIKNQIYQHQNETVTFNFNYIFKDKNISASFKRILKGDIFCYVSSISDLYYLFDFNVASDVLNNCEDEAVNIFCFDDNWHVASHDFGGGIFKVYVNDNYVESVDLFSQLVHGAPQGVSLSLADLGIFNSGNYNIKITHLPKEREIEFDDITGEIIPEYKLTEETEVLSEEVVVDLIDVYEPIDPELTVEVDDVVHDVDGMIEITIRSLASSARVLIDGKTYTISIVDGVGILQIPTLNAGTYTVTAISEKTGTYHASEVNKTFKVNRAATDIIIGADSIGYGEDLVVNITLPSDVKYRALVTMGNESKYVSLKNGFASVKYANLDIGSYDISVSYAGDNNYFKASSSVVAKVNRGVPNIEIVADDIPEGETLSITVKLPADVSRRASVTVGDESKLVSLKNGVGTVKFDGLAKGKHTIVVSYDGDSKYLKSSASTSISVTRRVANIEITANDINYGESLIVGVKLPSDVTRRAVVTIADVSKVVSLKDGVGSVKFDGLAKGKHTITVDYGGDEKYLKSSATAVANVNKGSVDIDVVANSVCYGDDLVVNITLPSDVMYRALVTIGNVSKYVSLKDGVGSVKFSGLAAGNHVINVSYAGDANYLKKSVSIASKVEKATPDIQITSNDINVGETLQIGVKLPSDVSRRAVVKINGESKAVSLSNGSGLVKINGLSAGSYLVEVSYNGDANYKPSSNTTIINVKN